jgi:hypothetical protein
MKTVALIICVVIAANTAWCEADEKPEPTIETLVSQLKHEEWRKRVIAVDRLGLMGTQAKEALPAIKSVIKESAASDMRYSAGIAIARIGGISELLELNVSTNSAMRAASLYGLTHFAQSRMKKHRDAAYVYDRKRPPGITPPFSMDGYTSTISNDADLQKGLTALAKGLADKNAEVSTVAAHELLNFCQNVSNPISSRFDSLANPSLSLLGEHILDCIITALSNPEADVKRCAAEMLSRFDSITIDVKDALTKLAADSDSGARQAAANTLKHFEKKEKANKALDSDKK